MSASAYSCGNLLGNLSGACQNFVTVMWAFTCFSSALGIHQYFSHPEGCSWQVIEDFLRCPLLLQAVMSMAGCCRQGSVAV